jgi:hypothetical protein
VEKELQELEKLTLPEVLDRARQGERQGAVSVSSEALVHTLRREVRGATTQGGGLGPIDGLLSILLQRCETTLRRHLFRFDEYERDEICREVLDRIVDEIYDDEDLADYAEVNFNDWLAHDRDDACRKQQRKIARTGRLGESVEELSEDEAQIVPSHIDDEASQAATPDGAYALSEARENASLPPRIEAGEFSVDDQYRIAALVKQANLPPLVLDAFLLHHYWGMRIESKDPKKHTLVKQFGKSEKTIRLWLKRAEQAFTKLRGENDGD